MTSSTALLDKCDVVLGGWQFNADRKQVSDMVPKLSRLLVHSGDKELSRLFENRSAEENRYSHTLVVRGTGAGEGLKYPHPTFSGFLKLREVSRDNGKKFGVKPWEGLFHAYLNVNRSLQAQTLRRQKAGPDSFTVIRLPYALANLLISGLVARSVHEQTNVYL